MISENKTIQFEYAIRKALDDFNRRLEQQRLFQIQNRILKKLYEEVKKIQYCHSSKIKNFSLEYEDFCEKLDESGRSYENIFNEKNLVDTYNAFEKFIFDCFCSLYTSFPKHLGEQVKVATQDLFIDENIELCKKNFIESKVKDFIQANNIVIIIDEFRKGFDIKIIDSIISKDERFLLLEISLIRNLVIHNNSIVNSVYKEQVKKFFPKNTLPKYTFVEGDTILEQLDSLVLDIKNVSTTVCERIAKALISEQIRLKTHHENM